MTLPGRSPGRRGWGGGGGRRWAGLGRGLRRDGRRGTQSPGAAGRGHRTRRRPRRGGRGPRGSPRVQSGTGLSNFPECGMRLPAPPGGGAAAPFPGGAARSPGARVPDPARVGATLGPAWPLPPAATMNGPVVPGPGGSRHLRPGRPSTLALGPSSVPARQAPRLCPGQGGQPARASSGTGCFRGFFPYCKPPAVDLLVSLFVDGS